MIRTPIEGSARLGYRIPTRLPVGLPEPVGSQSFLLKTTPVTLSLDPKVGRSKTKIVRTREERKNRVGNYGRDKGIYITVA